MIHESDLRNSCYPYAIAAGATDPDAAFRGMIVDGLVTRAQQGADNCKNGVATVMFPDDELRVLAEKAGLSVDGKYAVASLKEFFEILPDGIPSDTHVVVNHRRPGKNEGHSMAIVPTERPIDDEAKFSFLNPELAQPVVLVDWETRPEDWENPRLLADAVSPWVDPKQNGFLTEAPYGTNVIILKRK